MTVLPFVCLGIGIVFGLFIKNDKFVKLTDRVTTVALIFLMLSIGVGIGLDESIINNALKIGLNCVVIALFAITFSVLFTVLCEKTILPLGKLDDELKSKDIDITKVGEDEPSDEHSVESEKASSEEKPKSHLVWIMPASVFVGLLGGILLRGYISENLIDVCFTLSLIFLYICVGVSQGANKEVFLYLKMLGIKVIFLSLAILIGSIIGGILSGLVLGLPIHVSLISSSGMSFYSITGAYMTDTYGLEIGTYGFIVNIMREVFTILLMPILIKISSGSPIAAGAAGNMDTMLAPVTRFVGVRLGLVALVTGTVLTLVVPLLLPIVGSILSMF